MKIIFLTYLRLGFKHKIFGDFVQRHAEKCIVSKLVIDITTSEWSVKGEFVKGSFILQEIHSFPRQKNSIKNLFLLLPLHSKLCVLLFVTQVNEKFLLLHFPT